MLIRIFKFFNYYFFFFFVVVVIFDISIGFAFVGIEIRKALSAPVFVSGENEHHSASVDTRAESISVDIGHFGSPFGTSDHFSPKRHRHSHNKQQNATEP